MVYQDQFGHLVFGPLWKLGLWTKIL